MINCGIDIIEISRIDTAIKKTKGFLEKVFSEDEIAYYIQNGKKVQSLAGFFAAKEAYSKFLGTGLKGFKLNELSVKHKNSGQPYLTLKGKTQDITLSISHNDTTAVAVVYGSNRDYEYPCFDDAKLLIPKRKSFANKGDFGKVLVIAGSKGMVGAAVMSAYSALRTGSGIVTLATVECERQVASGFYPEIMTYGLKCENGVISVKCLKEILTICHKYDSIVFGPGLGKGPDTALILAELLKVYTGKLLIDADGLNALAKNVDMLKEKSCSVVLTPHPGEMGRLLGLAAENIQKNRRTLAEDFVRDYDVCLVLKGSGTIVCQKGKDTYINQTGNPGLAKAGTGDVLSGIIGSLLGQGLDVYDGARLGAYLHGLAGDIAKERFGEYSMLATDVIDNLPKAIGLTVN